MRNAELSTIQQLLCQIKYIFKWGEKGVPLHSSLDQGEVQIRTQGQRLFVDLGATANENVASRKIGGKAHKFAKVADRHEFCSRCLGAGRPGLCLACQNF